MGKKSNKNLILSIVSIVVVIGGAFGFWIHLKNKNTEDSVISNTNNIEKTKPNAKVSVVIPVYNTEKYLEECLNSVETQTLKEIEIICVNDGSKDKSLEILKNHREKDDRIKIIDQENAGVSVARNNGIKSATGEYIAFIDSDDLVLSYAYEKAYASGKKYNVNIVTMGNRDFPDGEELPDASKEIYDESKIELRTCEESDNPFTALKATEHVIWNKLWKRSFLIDNDLHFKEGIIRGEDALFTWLAIPLVSSMVRDENIFYYYRTDRPGSAMAITNEKQLKRLDSYLIMNEELVKYRNRFKFKDSDNWLLDVFLIFSYNCIIASRLENSADKVAYSKKLLGIIDEPFLKKYNVKVSQENQTRLDALRKSAEDT